MNLACTGLFANTVAELLLLTKEQLKEAPISYLLLHTEASDGLLLKCIWLTTVNLQYFCKVYTM